MKQIFDSSQYTYAISFLYEYLYFKGLESCEIACGYDFHKKSGKGLFLQQS